MNTLEIPHLNPDGSITREWLIGSPDADAARKVTLTRSRLYPLPARRGPAWYWLYAYQTDNGVLREFGQSVGDITRFVKRTFPNATIVRAWERSA